MREALLKAGYFFPTITVVYLLVGVSYLTNRFVPLATIVLFPVAFNVVLYHLFLIPSTLPVTGVLLIPNLFMFYACREAYRPLLQSRA